MKTVKVIKYIIGEKPVLLSLVKDAAMKTLSLP